MYYISTYNAVIVLSYYFLRQVSLLQVYDLDSQACINPKEFHRTGYYEDDDDMFNGDDFEDDDVCPKGYVSIE